MNASRTLRTLLSVTIAIAGVAACGGPTSNDLLGRNRRPVTDTRGATPSGEPDAPAEPEENASPAAPAPADPETTNPTPAAAPADPAATPTPTPSPLAERVGTALAYGNSVIGTPYGWWYGGALPTGAPMWTSNGPPPAAATVKASSTNCAGLTNLMLRAIGKPLPSDPAAGTGGTGAYGIYYAKVAKTFDPNAKYPAGTLIGRYYRDTVDQGHVAVVLADGRVLQSFANAYGASSPGVNATYTVAESHAGYFYEYAVMPEDWLGP